MLFLGLLDMSCESVCSRSVSLLDVYPRAEVLTMSFFMKDIFTISSICYKTRHFFVRLNVAYPSLLPHPEDTLDISF